MKSKFLLILIITTTTLLFFASTSAISGFSPSKVHEVNELLEKDGVVKRTTLFKKSLKRLEIGHLAASFCCLHINTPHEGDYDDPENQITTGESPPGYDDIIRYKQAPAEVIEVLIKSCYERYLILEQAECFSLIEGDLEKALHDFPSFTGSDSWHSALLYQLQRKILIQTSNYEKARSSVEKELTALDFTFIEACDPSIIADYACILEHLGQSGIALDMLENRVTAESRPYIRRHAALWRARHFTATDQLERAEEAYLDVVLSSNCDPHCGKGFTQSGNLVAHQRIRSGDKSYKCEHSGKGFTRSSHLATHQRTHSGDKPYKCERSGKGFTRSSHLATHQRTHSGDKPYKREHCGKRFGDSANLTAHQRILRGDKPYKCEHCEKGFTRSSHLAVHLRIHSGGKPYKCEYCGKGFTRSSHLATHLSTHSGDKPYKCEHCGKGFTQSDSLAIHLSHSGNKSKHQKKCPQKPDTTSVIH